MGLVSDASSPASHAVAAMVKLESTTSDHMSGGKEPLPGRNFQRGFQPPRPAAASRQAFLEKSLESSQAQDSRSQKSEASQSSMASNDLDAYTESFAQVNLFHDLRCYFVLTILETLHIIKTST
jgi:hypothetical protein